MNAHEELWRELDRAAHQFNPDHTAHLFSLGVSFSTLQYCPLGYERIEVEGNRYIPSDDGQGAVIQPIFEWTSVGPYLDEEGHLLPEPPAPELTLPDLMAWHTSDPLRWWTRRGEPALMLGGDELEDAAKSESPLKVYRDPLNWLRNDCRGVVLIAREGLESAFVGIRHLDAQDLEHGQELHGWLHQPDPFLLVVRVPEKSERIAA